MGIYAEVIFEAFYASHWRQNLSEIKEQLPDYAVALDFQSKYAKEKKEQYQNEETLYVPNLMIKQMLFQMFFLSL